MSKLQFNIFYTFVYENLTLFIWRFGSRCKASTLTIFNTIFWLKVGYIGKYYYLCVSENALKRAVKQSKQNS